MMGLRFSGLALTIGVALALAIGIWLLPRLIGPGGRVLSGEAEIGLPYRVELYTHCGLRHVEFDGSNWAISGVLGDGFNPPSSFNNPIDHGTVTLVTHVTAKYRSEFGDERTLTRDGGLPWVEGCL